MKANFGHEAKDLLKRTLSYHPPLPSLIVELSAAARLARDALACAVV